MTVKCDLCGREFTPVTGTIGLSDGQGVTKKIICPECARGIANTYNFLDQVYEEQDASSDTDDEVVPASKPSITMKPSQIKAQLDRYVIGQDNAKEAIAVGLYNHWKLINNDITSQKSNILLVGSTGVGKTELARSCAKILHVPFSMSSITNITQAGYVGGDVEDIIKDLVAKCDGDIEKAQHGVVYIDELDKIARKGNHVSADRDVSGEGVQDALLEMIEGKEMTIKQRTPMGTKAYKFDTSKVLFILGGAFEELTMPNDIDKPRALGFGSEPVEEEKNDKDLLEQLRNCGVKPELLGRIPVVVKLDDLTRKDMIRILTEPENSLVKQYTQLINLDGVKLDFTKSALETIADKALARKTGARALRGVMENTLQNVMFNIPDILGVKEVKIHSRNGELVPHYTVGVDNESMHICQSK